MRFTFSTFANPFEAMKDGATLSTKIFVNATNSEPRLWPQTPVIDQDTFFPKKVNLYYYPHSWRRKSTQTNYKENSLFASHKRPQNSATTEKKTKRNQARICESASRICVANLRHESASRICIANLCHESTSCGDE